MCNFPRKRFTLNSPLPAGEVLSRLATALASKEGKLHGAVTGESFAMANDSKLPARVTGTVKSAGAGSILEVQVVQDGKLSLGEIALLVVLLAIFHTMFPQIVGNVADTLIISALAIGLYASCFFSEADQAYGFLHRVAGVIETQGEA